MNLIVIFGKNLQNFNFILSLHILSILCLIIFYYITSKFKLKIARDWYLIFIVTFFYEETGYLNQMVFQGFWDKFIMNVEYTIFHCDIGKMLLSGFNHPVINEIMYFFYFSYYIIIPALAFMIYRHNSREEFHYFLFTLMFTYFFCYLLYIFIPIAGPFEYEQVKIKGFIFEHIIKFFYQHGELPGSAMPSSHVAIALTVLLFSKKYNIKFPVFIIIFIMLSISTVYLRYHYILDVVAGILTGIFCYFISSEIIKRSRLIQF